MPEHQDCMAPWVALSANFACLHGPHRPQPKANRLQWWQRISKVCTAADENLAWIVAMDGNIRVGEHTSPP